MLFLMRKMDRFQLENYDDIDAMENLEDAGKDDKALFDEFFKENFCPLDYAQVRAELQEIVGDGYDLLVDGKRLKDVTRKNYVIYMNSDIYCQIEECIEDAMNELSPDVADMVMDITAEFDNADEITAIYWDEKDKLMKEFLGTLFDEYVSKLSI